MESVNTQGKRMRTLAAISASVSLLFGLLHLIQRYSLKSDGAFYVETSGTDVFAIFAIVFMAVSVVLFIIDRKRNTAFEQASDAEIQYKQYRASNRFLLIAMLIYFLLFIISYIVLEESSFKIRGFMQVLVLIGFSISIFIIWNVVFYLKHRNIIKQQGIRIGLSFWTQISAFFVNLVACIAINDVFSNYISSEITSIFVPLIIAGVLGLLACAIIRIVQRVRAKNTRQDTGIDSGSVKRALYIFLICTAFVVALACVLIPLNTSSEIQEFKRLIK